VLVLSLSLFMYSYGYGAIQTFSAVFADAIGVAPKSLYLTLLAVVILCTRPLSGPLADRIGPKPVLAPALTLTALGLCLLAWPGSRGSFIWSAIVFGVGFGTAYPVFVAYVMQNVDAARRGAAFGAILAAFDTGIGTGSTMSGWLIQRFGFVAAFGTAAALAGISLPYFLLMDRRLR
jgi:MFS family permease